MNTDRATSGGNAEEDGRSDSQGGSHGGRSHATASTANLVAAAAEVYALQQQAKVKTVGGSPTVSSRHDEVSGSRGLRIAAGFPLGGAPGAASASTSKGSIEQPGSSQALSGAPTVPSLNLFAAPDGSGGVAPADHAPNATRTQIEPLNEALVRAPGAAGPPAEVLAVPPILCIPVP